MREVIHLTPELLACIGRVRDGAPANYREEKLAASAAARGLDAAAEAGAEEEIAVAAPDELPRLHDGQRQAIDGLVECALGYVDRGYPLLEGEAVVEQHASFLTRPYLHLPPGTAVIRRTTNMADLYYLVENVEVDARGDVLRRTQPIPRAPMRAGGLQSVATQAAGKFAVSLAGTLGGALGSLILDALFPPGVPSWFDEVYEEMAKIVGQRLDAHDVDTINGAINAVKEHLATEYQPARARADLADAGDRAALFALLQKYDTTFLSGPGGMLGTLQSQRYGFAGFGVFLLGAGIQLSLFQEMANVAPQKDAKSGTWLPPRETSYGRPGTGTVASTARRYADYAEGVWPKLLDARVKGITWVTWEADRRIVAGDVMWTKMGGIDDQGKRVWPRKLDKSAEKDGSYPTQDALKRDVETYKSQVRNELTTAYSHPLVITKEWRRLVEDPIRAA